MSKQSQNKVLLIGWDAADWKIIHPLMDQGKMPTVQKLVEGGGMANLATLHPVLSPMLWTSIATGKRPFKHGIHGFSEPTPDGQAIQPITNFSRKTKAVWNILSQNNLRSNVIGWWPSHPAEPIRGTMVSNHFQRAVGPLDQPWPAPPRAVHPPHLTRRLTEFRVNPNELLAEHILPFVPRAGEIDQDQDRRLASCAKILAECTSVHAVATWLMQHEPWEFTAVYYDAIDHFCHGFMRYHPPRQEHVAKEDFELYRGVVEAGYRYHDMMLNTLLEMAGPDVTVILMSDHGFHPDHLRPRVIPNEPAGPALEHRDFGIFIIRGPGIREDALLHGLNLLDITPTLLTLFGLPVGEDMDGQPAIEAFLDPPLVETVPSWDVVDGEAGLHPPELQLDPVESQQAIEQLVALGYIEPPGPDHGQAVARTVRELRYNLARAYMDDSRHGPAAEILESLYARWPHEHRFGVQLAMCFQALDRIADLRSVVTDLSTRRKDDADQARAELQTLVKELRGRREQRKRDVAESPPATNHADAALRDLDQAAADGADLSASQTPLLTDEERRRYLDLRSRAQYNAYAIDFLWGQVCIAEGDYERGLDYLLRSEAADAQRPGLHLQIGEAYLKLRKGQDAERSFHKALAIDAESPYAYLGLARVYLLRRQNRRAAEAALKSIGLLYQLPMAHYCLGLALYRMGRVLPAVDALQIAISLNPNFAEAHARLASIYRRRLGEQQLADEHRQLAQEMRQARREALAAKRKYQSTADRVPRDGDKVEPIAESKTSGRLSHADEDPVPADPAKFITVVSGLPRSGTSLVMQMLAAGGMEVVTDGQRKADPSNPRGYLEYERVKNLRAESAWLGEIQGKAIKIIAQLLPHLPLQYRYRVLFVNRDLDEVLASQRKMLARDGRQGAQISDEKLKRTFINQVNAVLRWLATQRQVDVLTLAHRQIVAAPAEQAQRVNEFLGGALGVDEMAAVVDPMLYRNRL